MGGAKVAVIGLGVTGLATLKNLLEEGFDATGFDGRDTIGGLWKYSSDAEVTSVLETTISNKSRFKNSYTDFPYPENSPAFPTAVEVQDYLESYASNFQLLSRIRLRTKILTVTRNEKDSKWIAHFQNLDGSKNTTEFDKVAICSGAWGKPKIPDIAGRNLFKGDVIHSQAFKSPSQFKGKSVAVLGIGSTAADIATALVGHARKIYLPHRGGTNILPRIIDGRPADLIATRRLINVKYALNTIAPSAAEKFFNVVVQGMSNKAFKLRPEWRIHPPNSIKCHSPTVSDTLVSCLEDGSIISKHNVQEFTGPNSITFADGTTEEVDVLICCTNYTRDFSLIPELRTTATDAWSEKPKSDGEPLQKLYQNIFPPSHADSIAFLNNFAYPTGFMWIADLASMAVAQVWKGTSQLPSVEEMNQQIDKHHAWLTTLVDRETVASDFVQEESWLHWCHDAAGTGVNENLGYRFAGWSFWARNMKLSNLLMGGVETPFTLRLFDGKRKKWDGTEQAIVIINSEVSKL